MGNLTPEEWANLTINGQVTKVTIASPTTVAFKLTDAAGKPIVGIGKNTSTSTAGITTYSNIRFELAKLVPGTNGSPSTWVSYIVQANGTNAPTAPTTDQNGKLVDNGDGTYVYTFARDIPKVKEQVAAATNAPAGSNKADLGDLTFDGTLQHRLVIQISGSNNGATLENASNVVYNFVPSTGATIADADLQWDLVDIKACNGCHQALAFHGGGRVDSQYCTTCHTTQRAFAQPNVASTNLAFPPLTETKRVDAVTGITSYTYSPAVYVGDGVAMGAFSTMVHKIHNGNALQKQNYNYANVAFNLKSFSMLDNGQRMCTVCHDPALASKAEYAYSKPSRKACGACHDGINWATGTGTTISGSTEGHIGRAQPDDSLCAACHQPATTRVDHRTLNKTQHNPAVTDGLVNFKYEIKSAAVDKDNNLLIEFRILQAVSPSDTYTPVTFKAAAACQANPLAGFTGSPGFLLAYAMPQDGVSTPADYNNLGRSQAQPRSVSIAQLLTTGTTSVAPCTGTPPNPNGVNGDLAASSGGYYIARIKGPGGAWAMPATAKMRSVSLQGYFTQEWGDPNLTSDDVARHAISVVKSVGTDAVRRKVVDATKCANCHEWFEGHGGNRVIGKETGADAELVCVVCHVPGLATSGRGIPDATMAGWNWDASEKFILGEWGVNINATNAALQLPVVTNNFKEMIHGIHAGRDRVVPFQDARNRGASITAGTPPVFNGEITLLDFRRMDFPGVLSNCEGCHKPGTYSSVPLNALMSVFESRNATYVATPTPANAAASLATANAQDTVQTPFGSACLACHDNNAARAHMTQNGARFNVDRSSVGVISESCQVCHGPGATYDAAVVHK